ncbi:CapA family protein [Spiractinospora alimapuensis]|nr:CapA family protein [Spiractinospora alimapuensis]
MVLAAGATYLVVLDDSPASDSAEPPADQEEESQSSPDEPRTLTLVGGGDLLIHPPVWEQAEEDGDDDLDFSEIFAGIAPRVSAADLALCHLETPLAEPEGPFAGYPVFEGPPQVVAGAASAGYDGCSTASNHTLDKGEDGVVRTLDALEEQGLGAAGSARTEEEATTPTTYEVELDEGDPVSVAHLSYSYSFNGISTPPGKDWMANLIDQEAILAEASTAREEGADIVVLSMHWGTEYSHDVDSYQEGLAEPLISSPDVDVVLGHHAHVVQPVERFDDEWVVYGMGNQLARHSEPDAPKREGAMTEVTFVEDDAGEWSTEGLTMVPTWVDIEPEVRVVDLASALSGSDLTPEQEEAYSAAHERITQHLDARDARQDGMEIASD